MTASLQAQVRTSSSLAFAHYNDGEWAKAAPLFLEVYEQTQSKTYLIYYTRCLVEQDQHDEALKALRQAYRKTREISLHIDQAYIYEMLGERKQAEEYYQKPFQEFPQNEQQMKMLGNAYISYRRFDEAQRVYEIGRTLLDQPDAFRMDMATLYRLQNRYNEMLDEYLPMLLVEPNNLRAVESYLMSALTADIDENLLELTLKKTLEYNQEFPGYPVFNELLIWVYTQQKNYEPAVDQAIALDLRTGEIGQRTLTLARMARTDKIFREALRAYTFIIENGSTASGSQPGQNSLGFRSVMQAHLEWNQTRLEEVLAQGEPAQQTLNEILKSYQKSLFQTADEVLQARMFKDMARLAAIHLDDLPAALAFADSAIHHAQRNRQLYAECLMDQGDYLVMAQDPWQATLIYARVEKENPDTPTGSEAKLRKAQTAFYTGDFGWALAQLDVLKGSTSKLIANDAFELALLIRENMSEQDSLNTGLSILARAKYLLFKSKIEEAQFFLDSVIRSENTAIIQDDALYMLADIHEQKGDTDTALTYYQQVATTHHTGIWGHKALFRMGVICFNRKEWDQAETYLSRLIREFPNSFYHLDARTYLNELRQMQTQPETSE